MKIFRFDDVCINADMDLIQRITDYLFDNFECSVIYGVSPLVQVTGNQRVFPEILNAMSDYRNFYKVQRCGVPKIDPRVKVAGHGLFHVDHRLLTKEAQEMSIVASCSLAGGNTFIPPFNKWNKHTQDVCNEHNIWLVKFEDGWRSMECNDYDEKHEMWYLHAREWTLPKIKQWFRESS